MKGHRDHADGVGHLCVPSITRHPQKFAIARYVCLTHYNIHLPIEETKRMPVVTANVSVTNIIIKVCLLWLW